MSIEILGLLVAGAGASYGWWALQRRREASLGLRELEQAFDPDAAVAWGVATHELTSRGHAAMWPMHLLYGLLQVEAFTAAIERLGGKPDAIETRVLDKLATAGAVDDERVPQLAQVLGYAYAVAQHQERTITITDLWARLGRLGIERELDVSAHELLFVLVHGMPPPPPDLDGRVEVHVVLRNDDITTQQFVTSILRDVFGLSETDAEVRMLETHDAGKSIVGRYKLAVARDKIITARSRARDEMFPLWIAPEDC